MHKLASVKALALSSTKSQLCRLRRHHKTGFEGENKDRGSDVIATIMLFFCAVGCNSTIKASAKLGLSGDIFGMNSDVVFILIWLNIRGTNPKLIYAKVSLYGLHATLA